jgi:hypothetical protein
MGEFHGAEQSAELREKLEEHRRKGTVPDAMSADEEHAVGEQMKAIDAFFAKRVDATYKIEIQFGKERSMMRPFAGALSLYLSGTKLNGGGDEKLYLCPKEGCKGIIYPKERLGAQVMCRECEMMWPENSLIGELFFRLTAQDWASVLLNYFQRLEHRADIYLKYHPTDIRAQTEAEIAGKKKGELVNKARNSRGLHIYPLRNIIRDTSNGADLYGRFKAFITA